MKKRTQERAFFEMHICAFMPSSPKKTRQEKAIDARLVEPTDRRVPKRT